EIEEKLTIFESTIDSLKKEISEKNDEFVTVVEKNSELEAKVVSLVVELSDAINFKDGLAEKCDGLRVELNGITEQGNEASKLNSELEMKIASAESEKFKIGETRDNLAQACDQLSLELATVIEYRNEAVAANAQLEAKVLSLESEQGEDGLVATCEQLRAELSSVTDLKNKAVESVSETEAKILSLESEKDEITNSRSQLADSHERLRAELIAVTEQKNEAVELNSELEAKIVLLESEKLVVKDQLERTCEELRAEVNAVTEQKHQAVKSSSELEAKVSFLESELCNVRDPKDPLCENDDGPSNRSSSQLEAKVLELESANADLVAKMTDLKETDKTENDQQSKQRQELTNIREELINANMLMETLEDRYNVLIQEKNVISDARDDLQSRYLQLETERNDILQASTAKLDELQNENENLVQKCTELMSVEAEFCEKNRSMDELKSRLGTVLEENENITKLCEELRLEVSSLENLEKEFESKIREINDLRSKIEDIEIENRQLVEKCDELTNVKSESRFEDKMDETKPDVTLDFDDNERSNVDDDVLDNTAYLEKCREVNKFESKLKLLQAEKKETITRCKELQTKIDNLLPKMNAMAEKCEEIDGLREKVRLLDSNDRDNSEYDGGQVSESRPVDQNYMFVDGETMKKMKNMQLESIEELANELINTKKQISAERDDNYSKQQVLHARVSEVENLLKVNDDGIQKLLTSSPFATPVPKKRKSDVLEDDKTTFRSGDGEIIRVKEENDDHEISLQIPEFIFEKETTSKVETREIEIQVGNGDELFTKQEYDNLRIENEELIVKLAEVDKTVAENEDNIKLVETLESEIRDYKTQIRDLRLEMENVRLLYESGTKTESEAQCDIISAREYAELLETKINLEDQVRNIRQEIEKYLESNESLIIDLKTKQSELDDSRRSIVEIEEILRNERADREQQRSCMLDDIKKLNEENVCLKSDVDKVEMKKERLMEETKRHIADVRSELTKEKETALAVQQSRMEKEVIENLPLIRQQITEKLD
ncbi:CENPE (predicted), partial [Pycnogonum litorale]